MARATQLGVKEGTLGLAEAREGKVLLDTFWYDTEVPLGLLSFESGECLFSRARCEALVEEMAPPEEEDREEEPGPIGARVVEEGVESQSTKVQLLHGSELDPGWDPTTDRRLNVHGEEEAAMLPAKMPSDVAAQARF